MMQAWLQSFAVAWRGTLKVLLTIQPPTATSPVKRLPLSDGDDPVHAEKSSAIDALRHFGGIRIISKCYFKAPKLLAVPTEFFNCPRGTNADLPAQLFLWELIH